MSGYLSLMLVLTKVVVTNYMVSGKERNIIEV